MRASRPEARTRDRRGCSATTASASHTHTSFRTAQWNHRSDRPALDRRRNRRRRRSNIRSRPDSTVAGCAVDASASVPTRKCMSAGACSIGSRKVAEQRSRSQMLRTTRPFSGCHDARNRRTGDRGSRNHVARDAVARDAVARDASDRLSPMPPACPDHIGMASVPKCANESRFVPIVWTCPTWLPSRDATSPGSVSLRTPVDRGAVLDPPRARRASAVRDPVDSTRRALERRRRRIDGAYRNAAAAAATASI